MKKPIVVTSVLAAALAIGAAGMAMAKEGAAGKERPTFEMLDSNGDGQITMEEMQARRAVRFEQNDTDGDGKLSKAELEAAAAEQSKKRVERMFNRMDANDDGFIEQSEMQPRRSPSRMFDRIDTDQSGGISAEEFAAAQEKMKKRRSN